MKTTISQQQISKSSSSFGKKGIHFLTVGFSPKISTWSLNFPRNDHLLEGGEQCSHSVKSHLFPNHWTVLSLAVALQIGWQILTQAGLPKQVINFLCFHFSDPNKVWIQHRLCLHCAGKHFVRRSTRFPWRARLKLLWIQAVTSLALNVTYFFQLHDIILKGTFVFFTDSCPSVQSYNFLWGLLNSPYHALWVVTNTSSLQLQWLCSQHTRGT